VLQTTSAYGTTVNLVVAVLLLSVILFFIYTIVFSANQLFGILPIDLLPRNHPWFKRLSSAVFALGTVGLVGFGLSLGLLVLLFFLSDNVTPVDALQLGLAGALLYVLYIAVGRPVQLRWQCSLRRPSESEAARLQSALEASGFDLGRVRVIELPDAENEDGADYTPMTAGYGPFRRLYVPEPLFEAYADEPLHALCATSVATWFRRYRTLITVSWLTLAPPVIAALSPDVFRTGGIAVLCTLTLAGSVWGGWQLLYRHDRQVADHLGPAYLVDGWETARTRRTHSPGIRYRIFRGIICMVPPDQRRLVRLRHRRTQAPSP
jgi:hypothetical protein